MLQKDFDKLMIKRENIKNIQRILLRLLSDNRENVNQNDIHQLIDEINNIVESRNRNSMLTMGDFNPDQSIFLIFSILIYFK